MITYRNFEIYPGNDYRNPWSYVHEDYDYAPDAPIDVRAGDEKTVEDCKRAIDQYYFERTQYRVVNERSITKFTFLEDAMKFINTFGGELETLVDREKISFDSL